jgi:carbamoyl-phosphate synthase large subunit
MSGLPDLTGKTAFVSGGAGVIGRELVPMLIKCGAKVVVGDLKIPPESFRGNVDYLQGDLNTITESEVKSIGPEIFFHLAATFERTQETAEFYDENYWNNVRLSSHLMSLMRKCGELKKVVFASSYLVYDSSKYLSEKSTQSVISLRESDDLLARNLVGAAKLYHEYELQFLRETGSGVYGVVCARIFRGYGMGSNCIISRWIRQLINGETISLYGKEARFDYIYARDSAEGLLRLAAVDHAQGIFNLGTGKARRVSEVVDILAEYFPDMQIADALTNIDYEASQASMVKTSEAINWSPSHSLESAIPKVIKYERNANIVDDLSVNNVLITSSSNKIPLIDKVQKACSRINKAIAVYCGDARSQILSSHISDYFWLMPKLGHESFNAIVAFCVDHNIKIIVPTRDGELEFWAETKFKFLERNIHVVVSPLRAVELCADKLQFAKHLQKHGVNVAPTFEELEQVIGNRIVVKERRGSGARNVSVDISREEASEIALTMHAPVFQPYVDGYEISADTYVDKSGTPKGVVLRKRLLVQDGEAKVTETFRDSEIEIQFYEISRLLGVRGPAVLQGIVDQNNTVHIIECNCRIGGASTVSISAGLDIFYWAIWEALIGDLDQLQFRRSTTELKQVRVEVDKIYDCNI